MAEFNPFFDFETQRIATLKAMAEKQNTERRAAYEDKCKQWVIVNTHNRDLGLPFSAVPEIPKEAFVDDKGNWTEKPFADLKAPVLPEPVPVPPPTGLPNIGGPDRLDLVVFMLTKLAADVAKIASKLGV